VTDDAWIDALARATAAGEDLVLVTVAAVRGSAPREAGTKMLVGAGWVHGTIGGGHLELQALRIARERIAAGGVAMRQRFPLGAALGQCCGGVVELLFEPVPARASWPARLRSLRDAGTPLMLCTSLADGGDAGKRILAPGAVADARRGAAIGRGMAAIANAVEPAGPAAPEALARLAASVAADGKGARWVRLAADGADPRAADWFIEPLAPPAAPVLVFGAGHVGRALVPALAAAGLPIVWVDARAAEFPPQLPAGVRAAVEEDPCVEVDSAPAGASYFVMTHEHALDQRLAEAILRRGDFAYFGLIGSAAKRRRFEQRLAARGIAAAALQRMTCPIGIAGIAGKRPGEIAIAAAAQLLRVRAAGAAALSPTAARRGKGAA